MYFFFNYTSITLIQIEKTKSDHTAYCSAAYVGEMKCRTNIIQFEKSGAFVSVTLSDS